VLKKKTIWSMMFLWVLASASAMGMYSILPLFLVKERALSLGLANTVFGTSRLGGVAMSIVAGLLVDHLGLKRMLFWALLLMGLFTIGVATVRSFYLLVGVLFFQATLALGFFPVGLAAISKLTTSIERSSATGIVIAGGVIFGGGVGPYVLGTIADRIDFQTGILLLGILTTLSSFSVKYLVNVPKMEPSAANAA
jgi:NNP family nitrate/nitrite transporter-like MFS transporter